MGHRSWSSVRGDDYLWAVSPPYRTAPHRQLGSGYGLTAIESARLPERHFRFVTSAAEYQVAADLAELAMRDSSGAITVEDIQRKGKGTLVLWVIAFSLAPSGQALAWVRVSGRACQPD